MIDQDTLKEFKKITGRDIQKLFANAVVFFSSDFNRIVSFYEGQSVSPDKGVFDNFDRLEADCESIFSAFHQMNSRFNNAIWWDVLDFLEQIDSRLKTLRVINKWSRSSLSSVGYSPSYQLDYLMKQNQTLERVSKDVLQTENIDQWYDIAVSNHLKEEDYTMSGGKELKLNFSKVNAGIQIEAVIAVMIGKAIYGLDLSRKIQFDTDEEDLKVLGYDETIEQSVQILASLKTNDNPAYPNDGLQREVVIGGTRASLNFPIIQRQLSSTFSTDDTLKEFAITAINVDQDNLTMNFQVSTRLDEVVEQSDVAVL